MAALVIPDAIQATLYWHLDGTLYANNVLHFRNDSPNPVDATMANVIGNIIGTAAAAGGVTFRSGLADDVRLQQVGVRSLNIPNEPEYLSNAGPFVIGTSTSDPLPAGVALVSTLRTNKAGRSYRGRTYWCGIAEGANTANGNPTSNIVTATVTFTNSIRTQAAAASIPWCVASRKNLELYPIISQDVDARWDTQRRRHVPGV